MNQLATFKWNYSSLAVLIGMTTFVTAQDNATVKEQMIRASAFFDASNDSPAQEIYEQLLSGNLTTEQKALLNYNLGVILLTEQRWHEALPHFRESLTQSISSSLNACSLTGIAWAHYNLAKINDKKQSSAIADQQSLFLLMNTLQEVTLAKKINCQASGSITNQVCHSPYFFNDLENNILNEIALLKQSIESKSCNPTDWQKGLFLLKYQLAKFSNQIDSLLELANAKNPTATEYNTLTVNNLLKFNDLWEHLDTQKFTETQKTLWETAKQAYSASIAGLKQKDLETTKQSLSDSSTNLNSLITDIWGDSPFVNGELLMMNLNNALAVTPFQKSSLKALQIQFASFTTEMEAYAKKNAINQDVLIYLKEAKDDLILSLQALLTNKELQAQIWSRDGRRLLGLVLDAIDMSIQTPNSTTILKAAIKQQMLVKHWLELWQEPINQEEIPKEILSLFQNVQAQVILDSNAFLPTVKSEEEKSFQLGFCQQKPWESVLPLFDKGVTSALKAKAQLSLSQLSLTEIVGSQQNTLDNWVNALNALNAKSEKESAESQNNANQNENPSTEDPVSLLLQMESEDRSSANKVKALTKPGLKPW